jgi:hypothetical protein
MAFARARLAAALGLVTTISAAPAASPPGGGTISIEAATKAPQPFTVAAGEALAAKGFTVLEGAGHAAYVAELALAREQLGTTTSAAPVGRSDAWTGFGPRVGAGMSLSLPTGKSDLVPLQRTRLELRIRKRGEPEVLWSGTAVTVRAADAGKGRDDVVAADLSNALLRAYPEQTADVLGVP